MILAKKNGISLNSFNRMAHVLEVPCTFYEIGTAILNIIYLDFWFRRIKHFQNIRFSGILGRR
jgi:hypothetical protein